MRAWVLTAFGLTLLAAGFAAGLAGAPAPARAATDALAARCAQVRNDDTVGGYDPGLKTQLIAAFTRLFPGAASPPNDQMLRDEAQIRCMGGRLYACFVGANLPCSKMNVSRQNVGASAFCKDNPNSRVVPMAATGHDAIYAYSCRDGRARVAGALYKLDRRGFAAKLWTPLD